jgi:hypothetical protein
MVRRRGGLQRMPLEKQGVLLKMRWPPSTVKRSKGELIWVGHLQPSDVSPDYTVEVRYRLGDRPRIAVLDPPLDTQARGDLPHVYADDDLCLYTPGDWNATLPLATTVIPWLAEWLFHYEAWLATGVWSGGGAPYFAPKQPPLEPNDDTSRRRAT